MSEDVDATPPDERALRAHVTGARFQIGVDRGEWRLAGITWPHVLIAVAAAERPDSPTEVGLRFELSGYPTTAPIAAPWDLERDTPLDTSKWPKGDRVGKAFNPSWKTDALYIPCDRAALPGHDGWKGQHPKYLWDGGKDITFYLRLVHEMLNDEDYQGV
jgi:hypothetical protein